MEKKQLKRGNLRPTSASPRNMNEKLDKVIDLSQNLENKLNGIQTKTVEHENKLNQIEEKKVQLYNEMVQKRNLILFQRDRQKQYIRKENILIYGVEEGQEDDDDGEKILFTVADELEIDLQPNDIQRLGQKKRETGRSTHNHCKGLCHTKKETSFLLTNRISVVFKADSMFSWGSRTSTVQTSEVHAKFLLWYFYFLLHPKWQYESYKLKATGQWVTIASPDDPFNHVIDVDHEQMGCGNMLSI